MEVLSTALPHYLGGQWARGAPRRFERVFLAGMGLRKEARRFDHGWRKVASRHGPILRSVRANSTAAGMRGGIFEAGFRKDDTLPWGKWPG